MQLVKLIHINRLFPFFLTMRGYKYMKFVNLTKMYRRIRLSDSVCLYVLAVCKYDKHVQTISSLSDSAWLYVH